jgi:transposase
MSNRKFTEEFKAEAVKQVVERGYGVREVSKRLGISTKSLYLWLQLAGKNKGSKSGHGNDHELKQEIARLKSELKRVEEERDILKKAAAYFAKASR